MIRSRSTSGRAREPLFPLPAVVGARTDLPEMVDLIGLAEQRALPLARLLQQVAPRDRAVMRAVE